MKEREIEMWFLCVFYHRLLDYRRPEVESLAELFGAFGDDSAGSTNRSLQWKLPEHHHPDSPFHFVSLPSEEIAANIAKRSESPYVPLLLVFSKNSLLVS